MTGTRAATLALAAGLASAAAAPALARDCPSPRDNGTRLEATSTQLARAHAAQAIAGGTIDLAGCPSVPGQGNVTRDPDFNVMIAGAGPAAGQAARPPAALEFRTVAACDTVLLVHSGGVWSYDDDGADGANASVRLAGPPEGRYDVWVGTYGPASCKARLIVETHR